MRCRQITRSSGQCGLNGWGVEKNISKGINLQIKAAKQGFSKAQFLLGGNYAFGTSIAVDYDKALKWLKLASEQGHTDSQFVLSQMYGFGKGMKVDLIKAHMWSQINALNKNQNMNMHFSQGEKLRKQWEKKMTPAQIADAQKLARECVRKKYKGC